MDGRRASVALLARELRDAGCTVSIREKTVSPYIDLPPSWEAYLEALPGKRRYFVKRSLRDFESWAGTSYRIAAAQSGAELQAHRKILEELHAERWKLEGRRGVFASECFRAFHDLAIPPLYDSGRLELVLLEALGRPVSVLYNLIHGSTVYFYQSGRAIDVPQQVRVGTVSHLLAIRRSIERGLKRYDFLPGPSRYKMQLALATRPIVELRATRGAAVETARQLVEAGIERLRVARASLRASAASTST
jgi:CelD/BcsL family acetyltransferase involved in cellulose biosynthesis